MNLFMLSIDENREFLRNYHTPNYLNIVEFITQKNRGLNIYTSNFIRFQRKKTRSKVDRTFEHHEKQTSDSDVYFFFGLFKASRVSFRFRAGDCRESIKSTSASASSSSSIFVWLSLFIAFNSLAKSILGLQLVLLSGLGFCLRLKTGLKPLTLPGLYSGLYSHSLETGLVGGTVGLVL